jgi:putative ABC transport system permease protein
LVLSRFRPAAVLKGGPLQQPGSGGLRQVLVVAQFAVLIGLVLVALTITRQTLYGLNQGLRLNKDQVLLVFSTPCSEALRDEVRRLPGVRRAGCASTGVLNLGMNTDSVVVNGRRGDINLAPVDFGTFEVFGIKPLAGRIFERARNADAALDSPLTNPPVVINETAARRLGFASPSAAIGKTILWHGNWDESMRKETYTVFPPKPSEIIGVVPDFTLGSMREVIGPTLYAIGRNLPPNSVALAIKLDGKRNPETLNAINRLWKRYGHGAAMLSGFADLFTMRLYVDSIVQGVMVTLGAVIAVTVGALGLFALSAYTTERRTKEIGVRKAMGASSGDILKLLLWQFSKPVLLANVIAWPAAWLVMDWWLKGFVYRVDLAPWTFLAASAGAIAIALATVFVHALRVARARPVAALRYE